MITTDAALYGTGLGGALRDGTTLPLTVCSCGQELDGAHRRHCPRCGCALN